MAELCSTQDYTAPGAAAIAAAAIGLRAAIAEPLPAERAAAALSDASREIGWGAAGGEVIARIAEQCGWSASVVRLSLQALCRPFAVNDDLRRFANRIQPSSELVGFIMSGNIPGAGMHELVATLLAGRAAIIKTSAREPVFFHDFTRVIATIMPELAARMAVFTWGREAVSLTTAMRDVCDRIVVLGDDETIAQAALTGAERGSDPQTDASFVGFGTRVSGIVLTAGSLKNRRCEKMLHPVALDVIAFEQRGCLSPHHIFVGGPDRIAEEFAAALARSLDAYTALPPPARLALEDAAAIRRVRERARWRAIGGQTVRLWEGPLPGWTVIYDRDADFTASPGFRTVFVSPFGNATNLERRLAPVAGKVEAMGLATEPTIDGDEYVASLRTVVENTGASYVCEPGVMQSPPIDWPHGGGAFLRSMIET